MPAVRESRKRLTLGAVMDDIGSISRDDWLFIDESTERITLDLVCAFVRIDDYLDDEIESFCATEKLIEFFFKDQSTEKPGYTKADLEAAIDFYWENDAFICLERTIHGGSEP